MSNTLNEVQAKKKKNMAIVISLAVCMAAYMLLVVKVLSHYNVMHLANRLKPGLLCTIQRTYIRLILAGCLLEDPVHMFYEMTC